MPASFDKGLDSAVARNGAYPLESQPDRDLVTVLPGNGWQVRAPGGRRNHRAFYRCNRSIQSDRIHDALGAITGFGRRPIHRLVDSEVVKKLTFENVSH